MDYADVVETACITGPAKLAPYSGFARYYSIRIDTTHEYFT